jgi:glycosyltransferase involved in cell wall biosynthesis
MKIVFIAASAWPSIGGVERHILELTAEMIADGHQVTLIAPGKQLSELKDKHQAESKRIQLHTSNIKLLNGFIGGLSLGIHLPILLNADVIHYHDYQPLWRWGLWLHPLLRLAGKRIFITFHGWEGHFPPSSIARFRRRFIAAIVDGSLAIGHYISKWYATNSAVISYGGVRLPSLEPHCGDYALFVGRLERDTGILQYLEAFSQAHQEARHLRLIVCGDGSLRTQVQSLATDLGIEAQFLGAVSDPTPYYREARMVFASSYLAILEAFSFGKSVIAIYDNPLKQDYLCLIPKSEQMMWICGDIPELSKAIQRINSTPINSRSIKANKFAQENSWSHVKQAYYKLWGVL